MSLPDGAEKQGLIFTFHIIAFQIRFGSERRCLIPDLIVKSEDQTLTCSPVTLLRVTVTVCALETPIKFTVMVLSLKVGLPATLIAC